MPSIRRRYYNEIAARSRLRLDAISDGIFGVAMTLLVLTLVVPTAVEVRAAGDLGHALLKLMPNIVTYFMSFMTLGIFWVAQETQLSEVKRTDRDYTWIMLTFLLFVTLVPFSTALLAAYYLSWMAVVEYWFNIFLLGAFNTAAVEYAARAGLFAAARRAILLPAIRRRALIAQSLYALATALSIFDTRISIAAIVLIQLNYALAPRLLFLHRL
ncbi:MAG TPA: TMEM175 family protein [Acidimicrobiales bacterium]|nr:TMEM175 family protein [Acidimicrobiales bacterium]